MHSFLFVILNREDWHLDNAGSGKEKRGDSSDFRGVTPFLILAARYNWKVLRKALRSYGKRTEIFIVK
jgi:hypothetical protein